MKDESSWSKTMALATIGSSFVGTICLTMPFVMMQFKSPLPFMSTPRRKVVDALNNISRRREVANYPTSISKQNVAGNQPRYYDLGSGDGETVLGAASMGWRSTGIELNATLWTISSIRRWFFSSSEIRASSNFIRGDFWEHNISDADAVMIFGVTPLMPKIATKIAEECKPGTFILSYRFHVPIINQDLAGKRDKAKNGVMIANLVYEKDEMRIYELLNQR